MKKDELFNRWINDAINESDTIKAPEYMWVNISNRILNKQSNRHQNWVSNILVPIDMFFSSPKAITIATAIIICLVLLSPLFKPQLISVEEAATLSIAIDERIFLEHEKYKSTINDLKKDLIKIDLLSSNEQVLIYFENLTALDMMISKFNDALERNPYSVEVNTSLILAFQEKITALNHLINSNMRRS